MSEVNYKSKYQELKLKFMNSVDAAFRLGFEQGMQQAQQQQAQEQAMQAQQMQQAQAMGQQQGQPGEEGEEQPGQEEQAPDSAHPDGTELDQHIAQLEGMLGKSEPGSEEFKSLKKSLDGIRGFRNQLHSTSEMKKAEKAINAIGKALKPKFTIGSQANANMNSNAKASVNLQEKIVNDLMKAMEEEEKHAAKDITAILSNAGVVKE